MRRANVAARNNDRRRPLTPSRPPESSVVNHSRRDGA